MTKAGLKRGLAVFLSLMVVVLVSVPFVQRTEAAGTKTSYVMIESKTVQTTEDGKKETYSSKYTYDKKGNLKTVVSKYPWGNSRDVYTIDKKGNLKTVKTYSGKKQTGLTQYTYKKGKETGSKYYDISGKKKTLSSSEKITRWPNGKVKQTVYKAADGSYTNTVTYNKKGMIQKRVAKYSDGTSTDTYNTKGSLVKSVRVNSWGKSTMTQKTQRDKKGNLTKSVITTVSEGTEGYTVTETLTTIYKNTYKNGNLVKQTEKITRVTEFSEGDKDVKTSSSVTTYKYKKMTVAK